MKAYNGVAVLSRAAPEAVSYGFDDGGELDDARLLRVVIKGIPIVNTYVPQGFKIDSSKYAYKLKWFQRLRAYFDKHLAPSKPAIWCGDVNVAPEPLDVHSPEKHLTHVCFHEDVRRAYKETVSWGFVDVFRKLYPDRLQWTAPGGRDKDAGICARRRCGRFRFQAVRIAQAPEVAPLPW